MLPNKRSKSSYRTETLVIDMTDPLKPGMSLLAKLGSIVVHVEEAMSSKGHKFDIAALQQGISDPEVTMWLAEMRKLALIPEKR